jgi:hypothetical protein
MAAEVIADPERDTVGREAVDREALLTIGELHGREAQGLVKGDGVAARAARSLRRDDQHLAEGPERSMQGSQTRGANAVIIGDEDLHVPAAFPSAPDERRGSEHGAHARREGAVTAPIVRAPPTAPS